VPTDDGAWRGMSGAPGLVRVALSLAAGALAASATRRSPRRWRTPLIGLALAGAPLVPVYTGHALPLLALQGPVLSFVAGAPSLSPSRAAWVRAGSGPFATGSCS
jgi:hypothetical protein